MKRLILGTAGHIDHGKTSLVRRLTGIDTDRLPEEKQRGITIDLGFANLELASGVAFGIVDVPGHERFIHNMVAGATGVDAVLMVVAADDSVMPQTIEHLSILQLLGLKAGIVAITKADLVDQEHLEMVRDDLANTLKESFLATAPVVAVSSQTGQGIDELRQRLAELAIGIERPMRSHVFRLPVDRAFTLPGHGAIVTGAVIGGSAAVGDELEIVRTRTKVRVRRVQSHARDFDRVEAGQRAALNLAGVRHDELERGDEVCVPGYLQPSHRILVELGLLPSAPRPLGNRAPFRLHLATQEVTARANLRGDRIAPGQSRFLELRSALPVYAEYGQRFIVRQLSPPATIGGGRVIDPNIGRWERLRNPDDVGARLASADPLERLASFLETHDLGDLAPLERTAKLGIAPDAWDEAIASLVRQRTLTPLDDGKSNWIHRTRRQQLGKRMVDRCRREIDRRQPCRAIARATLLGACRRFAAPGVLDALLTALVAEETLVAIGDKIGPPGQQASLTKAQRRLLTELVERIGSGGSAPATCSELAQEFNLSQKEIERLLNVAADDELLARVAPGIYYPPATLLRLRDRLVLGLQSGPMTVGEIRDLLKVTRKYAVPLCEYFDSNAVTLRQGDLRVAAQSPAATGPFK